MPPHPTVIEVLNPAAAPGVNEADFIRWVGVAVAVAGAFLATPEGIAAGWRIFGHQSSKVLTIARSLLRRPNNVTLTGRAMLGATAVGGRAYASKWQPWRSEATTWMKVDILHKQVDILVERVDELRRYVDQTGDGLQQNIREAEARVAGQIRDLASELRGERSQVSRVDARGLGPIALGIVLTGLPDELATVAGVGYAAIGVSVLWTFLALPSWLRDYKHAIASAEDR